MSLRGLIQIMLLLAFLLYGRADVVVTIGQFDITEIINSGSPKTFTVDFKDTLACDPTYVIPTLTSYTTNNNDINYEISEVSSSNSSAKIKITAHGSTIFTRVQGFVFATCYG